MFAYTGFSKQTYAYLVVASACADSKCSSLQNGTVVDTSGTAQDLSLSAMAGSSGGGWILSYAGNCRTAQSSHPCIKVALFDGGGSSGGGSDGNEQ